MKPKDKDILEIMIWRELEKFLKCKGTGFYAYLRQFEE